MKVKSLEVAITAHGLVDQDYC